MLKKYQKYEDLCLAKYLINNEINELNKKLDKLNREKLILTNEIHQLEGFM